MDPLQSVLAVSVVVALGAVTWTFVRSAGLRRRLFVAIALATLLPSAAVATLLATNARSLLGVLESPGLSEGVDGGLGLARAYLEREDADLAARARRWAVALEADPGAVPDVEEGTGWVRGTRGGGLDLGPWLADATSTHAATRRVRRPEGTVLLVDTTLADGSVLTVGRRLPDPVARDIERVQRGSEGFRQLELFYRPLLATSILTVAVISVVAMVLVGTLFGRDVSARLVRPLGDLVEGTRRVAEGDLESRVTTRAVGEVAELVDAFNGMTVRLAEGERRLRRSERLAAWQGIARRLAHEIKNPLTPIQLAVHRLRGRADDPVTQDSLAAIQEEVVNLQRLAEEFSALGRLPDPRPARTPLAPTLHQVVELYAPDAVQVELTVADDLAVWADPGQHRQVVTNLVKNAVQALGSTGELRIAAARVHDRVRWTVDDDGPGLGDDPDRVFDAGFTTKSTGTGLGLAIVQRIVEDHGGRITAGPSPGGGARFTIEWPAGDPAAAGETTA